MQLIDGYNGGVAHISASMIRDHNLSLYGDSDCVLPVGNKFSYEVVNNNTIRISDGMAIIGGARATIEYGQTETAIIENGVSGYKRNDIIVIEYSKDNETLIESAAVKVVKGSIGSSGVDPNLVTGDVRAGATVRQMALYRVKLNGLSVEGVETLWKSAIFPVSSGGTGAATAAAARNNLLENKALSVSEGGTGVTSIYSGWYKYFDVKSYILDNKTIAAGGLAELTYNLGISGQRVLAGYYVSNATSDGTGASGIAVYGAYITDDGDKFVVKCRNTGSKAAKVKVGFKVLECNMMY